MTTCLLSHWHLLTLSMQYHLNKFQIIINLTWHWSIVNQMKIFSYKQKCVVKLDKQVLIISKRFWIHVWINNMQFVSAHEYICTFRKSELSVSTIMKSMGLGKKDKTLLITHWSNVSFALPLSNVLENCNHLDNLSNFRYPSPQWTSIFTTQYMGQQHSALESHFMHATQKQPQW